MPGTLQIRFGAEGTAIPPPTWFCWAIRAGRELAGSRDSLERAVFVVTTPCESAICGIMALGYLTNLLESPIQVSGAAEHFAMLYELPPGTEIKKLHSSGRADRYKLLATRSLEFGIKMRKLTGVNRQASYYLMCDQALNYVLADTDEASDLHVDALDPYPGQGTIRALSDAIPNDQTWRASLDSVLIAGPVSGQANLRAQLEQVWIEGGDGDFRLKELLAIKEWKMPKDNYPHYTHFLNASRSGTDANTVLQKAEVVFFNGIDSFLRNTDSFESLLQVLVFSRDTSAAKIERVLAKVYAIRSVSESVNHDFPVPPIGIQWISLGTRQKENLQW